MSENKHQFHVGDWVNLKPLFRPPSCHSAQFQQVLCDVYNANPYRVTKVHRDGTVQVDAPGLENAYFRPGCLELAAVVNVPIDDLI